MVRMDFKLLSLCLVSLFTLTKSEVFYTVVGDDLHLGCSTSSFVDWYHGETKLAENDRMVMSSNATDGVITSTLTVLSLNSSDVGIYQCRIKDGTSVVDDFDVRAIEIEGNQIPLNKTSIDLQCVVATDIRFEPIRWERNGEALVNTSGYTVLNLTAQDANQTIIRIDKPDEEDVGPYHCLIDLMDSNVTLRHEASITMAPKVEPAGSLKIKVEDEESKIECKVRGYPIPSIKWYRTLEEDGAEEKEIVYDERVTAEPNKDGIPDAVLRLRKLTIKADRGFYKCVATNYLGQNETTAHLKVKDKNAAVWPFLGICAEVITLCCIIFIFEKRRNKRMEEEEEVDAVKQNLVNANGGPDEENLELRQRANGSKST